MLLWLPFWCCLGSAEQGFLRFMATWLALPDPVVLLTTYRTVWLSTFGTIDNEWYTFWMNLWGIKVQTVEIVPGVPVEAAVWDEVLFFSLQLWLGDSRSDCPNLCALTKPPFDLPV